MLFPCSVDVIGLKICSLVVISGVSGGIGLLFVTFDRTYFYPKLSTGIKLDILRDKIFHSATNRRIMVLTLPRVTTRAITQFKITQTTRVTPCTLLVTVTPPPPPLQPPTPLLLAATSVAVDVAEAAAALATTSVAVVAIRRRRRRCYSPPQPKLSMPTMLPRRWPPPPLYLVPPPPLINVPCRVDRVHGAAITSAPAVTVDVAYAAAPLATNSVAAIAVHRRHRHYHHHRRCYSPPTPLLAAFSVPAATTVAVDVPCRVDRVHDTVITSATAVAVDVADACRAAGHHLHCYLRRRRPPPPYIASAAA